MTFSLHLNTILGKLHSKGFGAKTRDGNNSSSHSKIIAFLPVELWLEIIALLPASSVPAVRLTCRSLGIIARPYAFQKITFRPYLRNKTVSDYMQYLSLRITFLASHEIVHGVKECFVSLQLAVKSGPTFDVVVDAIFDVLSRFPNLEKLSFDSVQFNSERLDVLRSFPPSILEINSCSVVEGNTPTPVKSLVYHDTSAAIMSGPSSSQALLIFLDPKHLRQLTLGPLNAIDVLATIASGDEIFDSLLSLDLPVHAMASRHIMGALSKCPNIRHLSFGYYQKNPERMIRPVPPSILQHLTSFDGPHQYAALFASGRNLLDVTLRPYDNFSTFCDPGPLCTTLKNLGPQVRSLDIIAITDPAPILPLLRSSFPRLKSLSINGHPGLYARCFTPKEITAAIQTAGLPQTLEHLTLGMQLRGGERRISSHMADISGAAIKVCGALVDVKVWYGTHACPAWVTCDYSSLPNAGKPRVSFEDCE